MKTMKKVVVLSLVSAMMLSVFAGCGKKNDSGAIRIGGTGPLTGGAAVYGMAAKRGAEIAVDTTSSQIVKIVLSVPSALGHGRSPHFLSIFRCKVSG